MSRGEVEDLLDELSPSVIVIPVPTHPSSAYRYFRWSWDSSLSALIDEALVEEESA
jgi:hypothetical protein